MQVIKFNRSGTQLWRVLLPVGSSHLRATSDGGALINGSIMNTDGSTRSGIVRLDSSGHTIWTGQVSSVSNWIDAFESGDSTVAIGWEYLSHSSQIHIVRFGPSGAITLDRPYPTGSGTPYSVSLSRSGSGGFSFGYFDSFHNLQLVTLDSALSEQPRHAFPPWTTPLRTFSILDFFRTSDGGYILFGSIGGSDPSTCFGFCFRVLRLNSSFEQIWDRTYHQGDPLAAAGLGSIAEIPGGGFFILSPNPNDGFADPSSILYRIDANGNLVGL